jgi:hypothetical protein
LVELRSDDRTGLSPEMRSLLTGDGGACQGSADLWCTYAATRTLAWLGQRPDDEQGCLEYVLGRQNTDGGFGWQKGLRSDVWATYYCTQVLRDLGCPVPRLPELRAWLHRLLTPEGGFSMTPNQAADIWATYYAVRTFREVLGERPPAVDRLKRWLKDTQCADGGLGWSTAARWADTRACYYGVFALKGADPAWAGEGVLAREPLVAWLRDRQTARGGFVFDEEQKEPDLWATFRATSALAALSSEPEHKERCVE